VNDGLVWSAIAVNEFLSLANLTEDEKTVFLARIKGRSRVWIATEYHWSLSTVDRTIKRLREKYDAVEPFTPLLQRRRGSTTTAFYLK